MSSTLNLGSRIELVPIDAHFHDITIALYQEQRDDGPRFRVHSYSHKDGARERTAFVTEAMKTLGGMEIVDDTRGTCLRFPCGADHQRACRRLFLEACKQASDVELEPRPLQVFDKKADGHITIVPEGDGTYVVTGKDKGDNTMRRVGVVCGGLAKLGDMTVVSEENHRVAYECGSDHHEVTGLLLVRAPNVRIALREEQESTSRGVLAAPSQQE